MLLGGRERSPQGKHITLTLLYSTALKMEGTEEPQCNAFRAHWEMFVWELGLKKRKKKIPQGRVYVEECIELITWSRQNKVLRFSYSLAEPWTCDLTESHTPTRENKHSTLLFHFASQACLKSDTLIVSMKCDIYNRGKWKHVLISHHLLLQRQRPDREKVK